MSAREPRLGTPAITAIPALVAIALLVAFGLTELFRIRFSTGDLYPYASSLRADPLGAKVLHEALREMPGVVVERHLRSLAELAGDRDTVVLLLGLQPEDVELAMSPLLRDAEALATAGARVVLALEPVTGKTWADPPEDPPAPSGTSRSVRRWKVATREIELPAGDGGDGARGTAMARVEPAGAEAGLPAELALHSALTFEAGTVDERSRVLYRRNDAPVVIERFVGSGSLVLVADGFLFANEGLSRDRQPAILAWVLGDARRVVFDESHLGVEESPGVMVLARRYRLLPVLGVLAVLAALFVWRSASGLLPSAPPSGGESRRAGGGDAASGLADILARGLDPRELLPICAERWAEDCARGDQRATRTVVELARQAKDPVTGYREIRDALATSPFRRGDHAD